MSRTPQSPLSARMPAELSRARWLALTRWGGVAIQIAALLVGWFGLNQPLPMTWLLGLVALIALSNIWLTSQSAKQDLGSKTLSLVIAFDVVVLTAMLLLAGGPTNPFTAIYLVYIALSAVMLDRARTWAIVVCCILGFGVLFYFHDPHAHHGHGAESFQSHLYGMFVAFLLAATLIGFFVAQLSHAVTEHERELAEAQERQHRWGNLASIASLAAGAAHELGTPLSTIAVASKEMQRHLETTIGALDKASLGDDVRLIREEVQRCRQVLDRIAVQGGEPTGEASIVIDLDEAVENVRAQLLPEEAERWRIVSNVESVFAPKRSFTELVHNLTRNSFDASKEGEVTLHAKQANGQFEFIFEDHGVGMDASTLKQATEPFFTTKNASDRMGLGLFLANAFAETMHGRLTIDSEIGKGTRISLQFPDGTQS